MATYKHTSTKKKLIKEGQKTKWAPFWTVPKIYGAGKKVHPGRHTETKRSWRRTKIKL